MRRSLFIASLLLGFAGGAQAQSAGQGIAFTPNFQMYTFGDGFGFDNASLLMLPLSFQANITRQLSVDAYSAYALGTVSSPDVTYKLNGLVDTRVRANWSATPWAIVTVGLNLPTGKSSHDSEEAVVASVLSTELLGFREASFGTGFGVTTGIATARRMGEWGIGFGASYRVASEFEPRADTSLSYSPGNEARARLALDRNFGGGRFTAGLTFQRYTHDKLQGRNLFQAGNRWRGDASYSFRAGGLGSWTAYVTDVWRESGDLTLSLVNASGAVVRDSLVSTSSQNLFVAGLAGAVGIVRPALDLRVQTRTDPGGSGWLVGFGGDVPLRAGGGLQFVPAARVVLGGIEAADESSKSILGGELGLTIRWGR